MKKKATSYESKGESTSFFFGKKTYSYAIAMLLVAGLTGVGHAEEISVEMDDVTVTATRLERKTSEVAASVTVINKEEFESTKQFNIKEVLDTTPGVLIESTNNGYDSRLIIRGAGLKAPYGVREIMVLRDGVPVTDPDSFTRLDMIDPQLIERIEVVKGPNSTMWGANAAGGVINIISKNPLDQSGGIVRVAGGEENTKNGHMSYSDNIDSKWYYSGSVSWRESDNSWRRNNEFSSTQVSLQPNLVLSDGTTFENMISYSKADLQLPGSLNESQFNEYLRTGDAKMTDGSWQFSGRYSNSYYMSSKMTKEVGDFEFIPMVFFNIWDHHHPVTARINDADTMVGGVDLQMNYKHTFRGMNGTMTSGVSGRFDTQDTDYFKYADPVLTLNTRTGLLEIDEVFSDRVGSLLEVQRRETMLGGVYVQESLNVTGKTIVDVGLRYDRVNFDIGSTQWGEYDWGASNYVDFVSPVTTSVEKDYDAISPRIGINYKLTENLNTFASASSGVQTPTEGEINDNPNLVLVKVQSYEVGLKGRGKIWSFDSAVYFSPVENEVVKVLQPDMSTDYVNAGETEKYGFEIAGNLELISGLSLTAGYSYTDYSFKEFTETVGFGGSATDESRNGNQLPFVPTHQYSLTASYTHSSGLKGSIKTKSWGSYYLDNANTEKYNGYDFATSAMIGYKFGKFDLTVNVDNLFDQLYATEITKDTGGDKSYKPAAPRTILARLNCRF